MIDIENLTKEFGNLTAVEALSLHVNEGEVFGFLGPNGAGKTTTVRMLCCLIAKTSGNARISGYEIGDKDDSLKIRKLIGLVPDNVGLSEHLSAYDNLDFYGRIYDCTAAQRKESIQRFLEMLGFWEKRKVSVGTFSKGMKQKLAIARALIHDPQVLFLDEPTANLDPESAMYIGASVFMAGIDAVTFPMLGYYYFPNWTIGVLLLILMPVAIIMSVEFSVIISSRVNDVRSASSFGILMFFPFLAIYLASQIGIISLDIDTLLIISGILFVVDVVLFFVSTATFKREEILTKWK